MWEVAFTDKKGWSIINFYPHPHAVLAGLDDAMGQTATHQRTNASRRKISTSGSQTQLWSDKCVLRQVCGSLLPQNLAPMSRRRALTSTSLLTRPQGLKWQITSSSARSPSVFPVFFFLLLFFFLTLCAPSLPPAKARTPGSTIVFSFFPEG